MHKERIIHYMSEPSNITPAWISESIRSLCEVAAQKRFAVQCGRINDMPSSWRDGVPVIVFCTTNRWTQQAIHQLQLRGVKPIVVGVTPDKFSEDISGVTMNRRAFIENILNYFVSHGRRRPALFGISTQISNDIIKVEHFLRVAQALHLEVSEKDVYSVGTDCENLEAAAKAFLAQKMRYDSVICSNDFLALFLLGETRKQNIAVPRDLWLCGYGNYLIGMCCTPSITSAAIDTRALAQQAFQISKLLSAYPDISHMVVSINCAIVPRGSTNFRPVPQSRLGGNEPINRIYSRTLDGAAGVLHNLENCLCQCDELNAKILAAILRGDSYEQIEADLFISSGAIRYRAKKMFHTLGVSGRSDFQALLAQYPVSSEGILQSFLPWLSEH